MFLSEHNVRYVALFFFFSRICMSSTRAYLVLKSLRNICASEIRALITHNNNYVYRQTIVDPCANSNFYKRNVASVQSRAVQLLSLHPIIAIQFTCEIDKNQTPRDSCSQRHLKSWNFSFLPPPARNLFRRTCIRFNDVIQPITSVTRTSVSREPFRSKSWWYRRGRYVHPRVEASVRINACSSTIINSSAFVVEARPVPSLDWTAF